MEKTKTNLKAILWHYFKRFLKWTALNLYRASLVILGYTFHIVSVLAELGLRITAFVARDVDIHFSGILKEPERDSLLPEANQNFEPAFTKNDIEQIASSINPDAKIKEIEEGLGVSYRQARKIQQAAKNSIPVNHYRLVDRTA